jgi:hypothetical protein
MTHKSGCLWYEMKIEKIDRQIKSLVAKQNYYIDLLENRQKSQRRLSNIRNVGSDKVHMVIEENRFFRYLCNRMLIPIKEKSTPLWNEVTCKNCLSFRKILEVKSE